MDLELQHVFELKNDSLLGKNDNQPRGVFFFSFLFYYYYLCMCERVRRKEKYEPLVKRAPA